MHIQTIYFLENVKEDLKIWFNQKRYESAISRRNWWDCIIFLIEDLNQQKLVDKQKLDKLANFLNKINYQNLLDWDNYFNQIIKEIYNNSSYQNLFINIDNSNLLFNKYLKLLLSNNSIKEAIKIPVEKNKGLYERFSEDLYLNKDLAELHEYFCIVHLINNICGIGWNANETLDFVKKMSENQLMERNKNFSSWIFWSEFFIYPIIARILYCSLLIDNQKQIYQNDLENLMVYLNNCATKLHQIVSSD